jgi:hypothetical protein
MLVVAYSSGVLLLVGVLALAVVLGLTFGGSLRSLSELTLRWWPLALVGLGLQLIPVGSHGWAVSLLVVSYAALVLFVVVNIRLPGRWLIALGFVLNLVVVGMNGGMPVGDRALRSAYGGGYAEQRRELAAGEGGAKHHLQRASDRVVFLSDVIPVPAPVRVVVSIGDLASLAGAFWLVLAATLGRVRQPEDDLDGKEPDRGAEGAGGAGEAAPA